MQHSKTFRERERERKRDIGKFEPNYKLQITIIFLVLFYTVLSLSKITIMQIAIKANVDLILGGN